MLRKLLLPLFLFSFVLLNAQNDQDSLWVRENYTKKEIYIPMRDGVKLFTAVYTPKDMSEKHPILMNRTPYSCAPYGTEFSGRLTGSHWKYYCRENYIIVIQDVRGRWMSEGEFVDVRPFIKDKKNNTVGIVGNSFDTTLLKQAQKQAEMANLAKTQFLALMSHELRTPLTGIICSANILAEMDKMPSEAIEFIGYIIESGQYLLSTVNNILDFAKLEANQFKLITSQINLRRTVEEIINILKVVAKEKKLDLFLEYENTLPANVIADPRVIRHILTNLVSNAIKFTDQGKITIQVRPLSPNRYPNFESLITPLDNLENDKKLKSCFFEIAVSDTGMGIPADKLDLIFNKFSQLEDDPYVRKKSHYGSGLGLTITKKMAELMGGKINVTSELGKGSTFCLIAKFNY